VGFVQIHSDQLTNFMSEPSSESMLYNAIAFIQTHLNWHNYFHGHAKYSEKVVQCFCTES